MASSSTAHGYYCHSCEAEVDANLQDFTCSNCRSGFIEEVNRDVNSGAFFTSQGLGPEHLMRSFLEELSPFASVPSSSEPEDETMLDDYDEPHPRRSGRRSGGNRHSNNVERITVRFPSQPVLTPTVRLSSSGNPLLMHFISGLNPLQGDIRNYVLNQGGFGYCFILTMLAIHCSLIHSISLV
ncbi:Heavy metal transport/detoxification protein domain-containing protein [Paragonimus heterotremus]|uniref:Heavy metal transport/detoxification protein domain-containing protein n=1 Tax=Paragonimus heterotremus TaxID=100268 RepID=A0A8J4WDP7_9TREM|nr:Heavy metal transport/detoxification protein domain-containing protein [Paragonimus heterotremus]